MALTVGNYKLGPSGGTLAVRTRKGGAAAKAGHNLLIEVTEWTATLTVGESGESTRIELTADAGSLQVREGTGGMTSLGEDDKAGINQTIDQEVLRGASIAFRSTAVDGGAGSERLRVTGELELAGHRHPLAFELLTAGDRLTGSATVKQSGWGIKPYSALFGTLKVLDEVTVEVDVQLPSG